jgi:hypothetical protein
MDINICPFFKELQVLIFPNMIKYKGFVFHFCNVVKMPIIHKKYLITFGYKRVLKLKKCLNV